jgi:hypothetical protein
VDTRPQEATFTNSKRDVDTSISELTGLKSWVTLVNMSRKEFTHDGHEHLDVIEAHKKYLEQIAKYER